MGFPPQGAPPPVLEGNYSDWVVYDSHDDDNVGTSVYSTHASFNADEDKALFVYNNVFCKLYDVSEKTIGSSLFYPGLYGESEYATAGLRMSVLGTYRVFIDESDKSKAYIMKNGSIVKTLVNTDIGLPSGQDIISICVSRSGKYVVVVGTSAWPHTGKWVILVGS